jgi:osmotically-inducible protein OsmY
LLPRLVHSRDPVDAFESVRSVDAVDAFHSADQQGDYQKEAAERAMRDLVGVKGVINEIEVKPKVRPEDPKRRIEAALVRSAETDVKNIQVDAYDGRVVLRGRVHSWYEKEEAKREAWLAPGVREVVDELTIAV